MAISGTKHTLVSRIENGAGLSQVTFSSGANSQLAQKYTKGRPSALLTFGIKGGFEAGVKFYVTPSTFIYILVEYQFFFDHGAASDAFSDGQFLYTAGIGFRF